MLTVPGAGSRRTHQSGPLGELFDHGVDALNTTLEVLIFAASQNMGQGWRTVATLFASLLTFYVQTWDEFHTQTLTLGVINGPVEGILLLVVVYAATGLLGGASFWQQPMLPTLGIAQSLLALVPDRVYNLSFTDWYMVQGAVVLVFNTFESARNVLRIKMHAEAAKAAEQGVRRKKRSYFMPLAGLLPFFGTWALVITYLALNPTILHQHLVPFALFCGFVNAYSVGRMITAHLVGLPFPYDNVLAFPLAIVVADGLGPRLPAWLGIGWPSALGDGVYQVAAMFLMLGLAIGVYGSFVVDVIVTICDYLDIWCLTIKHPYVEDQYNDREQPINKRATRNGSVGRRRTSKKLN
jgi:ethanolaminephosphotransferase